MRKVKKIHILILSLLLASCQPSSKNEVEGIWIMQYNPDHFVFDTTQMAEYFDSSYNHSYTIRTDTGLYEHIYLDDSLIRIEEDLERTAFEFEFNSQHTGTLYNYPIRLYQTIEKIDRIYGSNAKFDLRDNVLKIEYENGTFYHTLNIEKDYLLFNEDTLIRYELPQ